MCHAFHAKVALYLMRTVFLLDITVACFSNLPSAWMSDEAAAIWLAPAALSVLLPLVSLKDPPSFEGAERAHLLSLEGSCKPPVKERFWTMRPNRLSSPSISFLTHKQTERKENWWQFEPKFYRFTSIRSVDWFSFHIWCNFAYLPPFLPVFLLDSHPSTKAISNEASFIGSKWMINRSVVKWFNK